MKSNTTQLVKIALLAGKRLTVRDIDKMCSTNNGAEIVNRLRKQGYNVVTEWYNNENTGKRFGVYSIPKTKKQNRIKQLYA